MPYPQELLQPQQPLERPIDYDQVAIADPIGLSRAGDLQEIPQLTYLRHTHRVEALLGKAAKVASANVPESPEDAAAELRDLEFGIGSYLGQTALGVELNPLERIPKLREVLIRDGRMIGQQPRGSGAAYSIGNSRNTDPQLASSLGLERTFTGDPRERSFIESLRVSAETLRAAEHELSGVVLTDRGKIEPTTDEALKAALLQTADAFSVTGKATLEAMNNIPVDWFNANIAPWFMPLNFGTHSSPILVNGGSGAHFAPGIDYMLWGIDLEQCTASGEFSSFPEYLRYVSETLPYEDLANRKRLRAFANNNSTGILRHIADNYELDSPVNQAAQTLLASQRRFRFPHGKVAKAALGGRGPGKQVGGGGFDGIVLDGLRVKVQEWSVKLGGYKGRIDR